MSPMSCCRISVMELHFLFECVPLIGHLAHARCFCCCCCCGESQCFRAIREPQQLNANRPIEDGCNYCLAFALEKYPIACHAQLSSVRAHLGCVFVPERVYFSVKPPIGCFYMCVHFSQFMCF